MSGSKIRLWLVIAAIALATLLYFMPGKAPDKKESTTAIESSSVAESSTTVFNVEQFIENIKKQYRPAQLMVINDLESGINNSSAPSAGILDSMARAWDELKQPGIAAYYYELKAVVDPTERSYVDAAYRYFDAFKAAHDSVVKAGWVQKAIRSYNKVLGLNPKNLNAKTDLGICYAEGTPEPMKGIMLLREVVSENPQHENAQLNLGFLSVKSGQYEKALERFDKVLSINPKRLDVYIYKGETSLNMGDAKKAMECFEKFLKESPDESMKMQVAAYVNELKKSQ